MPQSKPVWLTEFGCPAVDKGANQPNVFPDPKSSENALPYFSNNARSDYAQRSYLSANIDHWTSDENADGMVDIEHSYIWTWDARPYPAFPSQTSVWTDGDNWRTGHWINGRLGNAPLGELMAAIMTDHGFVDFDVSLVEGTLQGYVQAEITSARSMLETLIEMFLIDVVEGDDKLLFSSKLKTSKTPILLETIADQTGEHLMRYNRRQETELANEILLTHLAPDLDYQPSTAYSRRLSRASQKQEVLTLPGAVDKDTAANVADQWLQNHWASRETIEFLLPIDDIGLEVGDRVQFASENLFNVPKGIYAILQIEDGVHRHITAARLISSSSLDQTIEPTHIQTLDVSSGFSPNIVLMDLPLITGSNATDWARGAAYVKPWTAIYLSSSSADDGYNQRASLAMPSFIGTLSADLHPGVEGRFDHANIINVDLPFGEFETIDLSQLLAGGNVLAIRALNDAWEIVQFQSALEIAPNQWQLSGLLRAQAGTEDAMLAGAQSGADVILINDNVVSLGLNSSEIGIELNWQALAVGKSIEETNIITFAGGIRAHTPLSPVHLRGSWVSGGISLSWIRRGRISADNWLGVEIPEDEDQIQFLVKIYRDEEIVHEAITEDSFYMYEDAQQLDDFGFNPTNLVFSVQQIGGQIAQGIARTAIISL